MPQVPELRGFFLGCGFNSAGIMLAGMLDCPFLPFLIVYCVCVCGREYLNAQKASGAVMHWLNRCPVHSTARAKICVSFLVHFLKNLMKSLVEFYACGTSVHTM
jgi:hypothetical protein